MARNRTEIVIVPIGAWFAYLVLRYVLIGVLIEIFSYEIIVVVLIICFTILLLLAVGIFWGITEDTEMSEKTRGIVAGAIALFMMILFFYAKNQIRIGYEKHKQTNVGIIKSALEINNFPSASI